MPNPDTPDHPRSPSPSRRGRLAVALLVAVCAAWLMLPVLTQHLVVPWLGAKLSLPGLSVDIRRLDLTGLDLGNIALGPEAGIRVRAAQLDWSLTGLARGRLDAVRILGLEILARHENEAWRVAGLPAERGSGEETPTLPRIDVLYVDGRVNLESAFLNLDAPFIVTGGLKENGRATLDARTSLAGQNVRARLWADLPARHFRLTWVDTVNATLSPLRLDAPIPLTLTVHDPHFDLKSGHGEAAWELAVEAMPELHFASPPRLSGKTEISSSPAGWTIRTRAELTPIQVGLDRQPGLNAVLAASSLTVDLTTNATAQNFDARLNLGDVRLEQDKLKATLTGLDLYANATRGPDGVTGATRLSGAVLTLNQPGLSLVTTDLTGHCAAVWGSEPRLEGGIALAAGATADTATARVTLNLPLAWPNPEKTPGKIQIELNRKAATVGAVTGTVRQTGSGLRLDGTLALTPVSMRGAVTGQLDLRSPETSWVQVKIDQKLALPGQLSRFAPVLGSLTGTARLDALIRLDLSRGQPRCPATLRVRDMELSHEKSAATLSKASLGLAFPDLLTTRSDPEQRLTFERLRLGSILLDQGDIRFQVETPHSILVERCGFRWAGGRIGTHAFRIDPGVDDYTVELHCDRVQLTQALEQLGMSQAQGGGAANGRIPIRYAHGSISFDDGFLYSTPGEKGILRIQGADILTAGVSPDSPQYAQLDLAAEALKDFAYDWARISLDTKGQELLVSLQLDGKPSKPLPFTFNRDIGGFVRVTGDSAGSTFQGIRLDANFRLPLDQLLQYRQLLDLIKNGG